ncbi:hypothetical protein [Mesobacillus zeae]|uniref:Prolipoprotein diacylglyceryl transferase n=1 Tax=Mesobacillus zeae TaxID=1917180 RepID=A0A398B7L7_9BACI|nr:hypothetical protein [Mesobacillus zeae]RID85797.1 hypothetical protein D1970_09700 [Mesobacillus zeae]
MEAFKLGPFIIKISWIFSLGAGTAAYWTIRKFLKEDIRFRDEFLDSLLNALLMGIVIYKLAILVYQPNLLFTNPVGALYLSGGWKEWTTALLLSSLYLLWQKKRKKWPGNLFIQAGIYGIATFLTSFWLFRTLYFLFF